jgi:hypothetical protein
LPPRFSPQKGEVEHSKQQEREEPELSGSELARVPKDDNRHGELDEQYGHRHYPKLGATVWPKSYGRAQCVQRCEARERREDE